MNTAMTDREPETLCTFFPHGTKAFRDIVEQARNGIVMLDRSGTIIIFNKAARKVVAKREDQVIGKPMQEILPAAWKDMQVIFHTGRPQVARRIDIGPHSIIANRTPIRSQNKVVGILSVLLTGESGVGKGLFAELIHKSSNRSNSSLIKVNCGAIPETLIEAELFGYESGAFTGARTGGKAGYLEMAEGGTLLLDEVGELPYGAQVKLLDFWRTITSSA